MGVAQKFAKGYGVIDLEHPDQYKPWIQTREVSSGSGQRHMIPDMFHPQRMIHLMSNLEKNVYYMLREDKNVLELFEQVPLKLDSTVHICEDLHIRHPKEPYTNNNIVMTTDFVAYVNIAGKKEFWAFAVKTSSDLKDKRVLEKLIIEKTYWTQQNIRWAIIDESTIKRKKGGVVCLES